MGDGIKSQCHSYFTMFALYYRIAWIWLCYLPLLTNKPIDLNAVWQVEAILFPNLVVNLMKDAGSKDRIMYAASRLLVRGADSYY